MVLNTKLQNKKKHKCDNLNNNEENGCVEQQVTYQSISEIVFLLSISTMKQICVKSLKIWYRVMN